jgi:hypothetical protein
VSPLLFRATVAPFYYFAESDGAWEPYYYRPHPSSPHPVKHRQSSLREKGRNLLPLVLVHFLAPDEEDPA